MFMELLVPAGDINSFYAALNSGADAIYLSGKMFGARSYAKNFTDDELKTVLKLGKIYGVKIYVTMNTLVKENEVEDFLKEVEFLYSLGVDAILMQDFGMISLCLEKYPNLTIHASTQVNSSSYETIKLLYEMGVKRVVLPREMSVDEIKKIGEFTSLCYYEEMALVDSKENDFNKSKLASLTNTEITDELVIIAHGKVRAGFDLSKLDENDIQVTGDTLSIKLPDAEIFDIILNPSDYEVFVETGTWSHEQFSALQKQASTNLKTHAEEFGIIEKAEETGIKKLDAFFRTFGFSKIFFI